MKICLVIFQFSLIINFLNCSSSTVIKQEYIIGGLIGAVIGLLLSVNYQNFLDFRFWWRITRKLKGSYRVSLKNGKPYHNEYITKAEIIKAMKFDRIIEFEMDFNYNHEWGPIRGEILFSTDKYGRGWYKHTNDSRYGFVELFRMNGNKIALYRKYTKDETRTAVEDSLVWDKIIGKTENC